MLVIYFVDATLSDSVDCRYKRSMFIGYVNKLISKFGHLQPNVLNSFNSCVTAWNIGVRIFLVYCTRRTRGC